MYLDSATHCGQEKKFKVDFRKVFPWALSTASYIAIMRLTASLLKAVIKELTKRLLFCACLLNIFNSQ